MRTLLGWMTRRGSSGHQRQDADPKPAKPRGPTMSGKYLLLHTYLDNRYADTVVLTFAEIEDLLGFALPDQARLRQGWWTDTESDVAGSNHRDSWILASRTAVPNLPAKIVVFERAS